MCDTLCYLQVQDVYAQLPIFCIKIGNQINNIIHVDGLNQSLSFLNFHLVFGIVESMAQK